ncbi:MAG: nuclear transport factor 2 family protein [Chloroflexi bacterium]|nr:nuclear transport factor 2 family protein [Chloroflexota bacterium]
MTEPFTVADQLEVRQLLARYPRCLDNRDADGYAGLFAPDGVVEMQTGIVDGVAQFREVRGNAAIRAMVERLFTPSGPMAAAESTRPRLRHVVGEPVIEASAEGCTALSYCVILRTSGEGASVASMGEYTDECVKVEGRWFFGRRRMAFQPVLG